MKNIVLIGGGGHCKSVIDVIEQDGSFKIVGIVDNSKQSSFNIFGYPVIGDDSDLISLAKKYQYALVTVGQIQSPALRIKLFNLAVEAGFQIPNIISPNAYVSKHAIIGNGTVVMHNALVNASTIIGRNCIINTSALIEHDSSVGDHCHIATKAVVNGGVNIGQGSFIGSGSIIKEGISISDHSFIKAGDVVK